MDFTRVYTEITEAKQLKYSYVRVLTIRLEELNVQCPLMCTYRLSALKESSKTQVCMADGGMMPGFPICLLVEICHMFIDDCNSIGTLRFYI